MVIILSEELSVMIRCRNGLSLTRDKVVSVLEELVDTVLIGVVLGDGEIISSCIGEMSGFVKDWVNDSIEIIDNDND